MKRTNLILVIILLIMAGGTGCKQSDSQSDDLITVDVTKSYPKKELILQDFMDVEYIALETNDEFVTQGLVVDITKNMIIARNHPEDGNIFIFDRRTGKAIKKINRRGEGAEEYVTYRQIILDEDNAEIFVNYRPAHKILVYDLDGNFKRVLKQNDDINFAYMYNFDHENLICRSGFSADIQTFAVVSKQDGSVTQEIYTPLADGINAVIPFERNNESWVMGPPDTYHPIVKHLDNWVLTEQSSDTVYRYSPDGTMTPFIERIPPVRSLNPEVFLFPGLFTGHYYFMNTVKKEFDFAKWDGFPAIHLVYDRQEKAIFQYTVYNDDYTDKRSINMNKSVPATNGEIASWLKLEPHELIEDYENGKLKGKLKELAATLDEESNPVIMLIVHPFRSNQ